MSALDSPNRDMASAHPLLRTRWYALQLKLSAAGLAVMVVEVWRSNIRQQWLYGQGRTAAQCAGVLVPAGFARPDLPKVTNAWSSKTSAHGWTENGVPASCAIDVVPVGPDNTPWTKDDRWDDFVRITEELAPTCGLRHFRDDNGRISDRPHLQLVEYSDLHHALILPQSPPPNLAA